jgi:hypothetical protein
MNVAAIGLVSDSCHECETLRERLEKDFGAEGIVLDFIEVNYDDDPSGAVESVSEFGMTYPPSFFIGEVVFTSYYGSAEFSKSIRNLRGRI